MKYSIKVNEVRNGSENTRGLVSVTLGDSFKLNNIAIMNDPREENKVFVSMPSYKTTEQKENDAGEMEDVYKDIFHPVTKEFRDELYDNILEAYDKLHNMLAKNSYTVEYNAKDTTMPEFTVRVTPFEKEGSTIKGLASINFDGMAVNNVSIHQGKDGLFVSMPSYKTSKTDAQNKAVYKDIAHPITAKFRDKLYGAIIQEYENVRDREQTAEKRSSVKDQLNKNKGAVEKQDKADKAQAKEKDQPKRDEVQR